MSSSSYRVSTEEQKQAYSVRRTSYINRRSKNQEASGNRMRASWTICLRRPTEHLLCMEYTYSVLCTEYVLMYSVRTERRDLLMDYSVLRTQACPGSSRARRQQTCNLPHSRPPYSVQVLILWTAVLCISILYSVESDSHQQDTPHHG